MSVQDVKKLRAKYVTSCSKEPWGEAAAVAVLLGFGRLANEDRFARHVDPDGVEWFEVLDDGTWSTTERFLLATAAALWLGTSRGPQISIAWTGSLDNQFFTIWQDMITAYRTGTIPARSTGKAAS